MAALQNNPFGTRPYKANLTGRYRFAEGRLKGLFVGGAGRFQSRNLTKYSSIPSTRLKIRAAYAAYPHHSGLSFGSNSATSGSASTLSSGRTADILPGKAADAPIVGGEQAAQEREIGCGVPRVGEGRGRREAVGVGAEEKSVEAGAVGAGQDAFDVALGHRLIFGVEPGGHAGLQAAHDGAGEATGVPAAAAGFGFRERTTHEGAGATATADLRMRGEVAEDAGHGRRGHDQAEGGRVRGPETVGVAERTGGRAAEEGRGAVRLGRREAGRRFRLGGDGRGRIGRHEVDLRRRVAGHGDLERGELQAAEGLGRGIERGEADGRRAQLAG